MSTVPGGAAVAERTYTLSGYPWEPLKKGLPKTTQSLCPQCLKVIPAELYELFPKGPAKLAARVGGIPKPRGCI